MDKNLKDLTIGISQCKAQLSEIIKGQTKKVVMKNNEPVAVVIPYDEYTKMKQNSDESKKIMGRLGQDIVLNNGVQIMVNVVKEGDSDVVIKTYVKMKTSGEYKLFFSQYFTQPSIDETLTIDEIIERMNSNNTK